MVEILHLSNKITCYQLGTMLSWQAMLTKQDRKWEAKQEAARKKIGFCAIGGRHHSMIP